MIRLLIGVFPAEEARERLRELAEEDAEAFFLPMGNRVAVYAGSYYSIDAARDFSARLARRGIRAQEESAQVMMTLERVTFGSFNNRAAAEEVAVKARAAGLEATVMRGR
jgi:cell division septation protein DedD